MTRAKNQAARLALALAAASCAFAVNDVAPLSIGLFMPEAHAIIGRPLTPLSYAGVARRTTARAVTYGAYAAPVYAAPVVAGPGCVQVAHYYGRLYTRCY